MGVSISQPATRPYERRDAKSVPETLLVSKYPGTILAWRIDVDGKDIRGWWNVSGRYLPYEVTVH
jgi:hypothetical protein